jgi:hypothetical protein
VPHPATTPSPGDAALVHAERAAAVRDVRTDLDERSRIEQQLEPLACRQHALGVNLLDALGAAARERLLATFLQLGPSLLSVHGTSGVGGPR